jgi:hypothetical protein
MAQRKLLVETDGSFGNISSVTGYGIMMVPGFHSVRLGSVWFGTVWVGLVLSVSIFSFLILFNWVCLISIAYSSLCLVWVTYISVGFDLDCVCCGFFPVGLLMVLFISVWIAYVSVWFGLDCLWSGFSDLDCLWSGLFLLGLLVCRVAGLPTPPPPG